MLVPWIVVAVVAYVLGSIPSGVLVGRLYKGIDVRDYGSKRTGATNVLRTMGTGAAAIALVMDVAKAVAAVVVARWLLPDEPWSHILAALAVTAGHNWPLFAGFRGGRGVIVSAAAVGVLYLPVLVLMLIPGLLALWRTRYVSLGSIVSAAVAPPLFLVFYLLQQVPFAYLAYAVVGAALVILSHKDNIGRLLAGSESRLGQRVSTAA
jgi:glycerol-3-phosphate acyltransferase PlsY